MCQFQSKIVIVRPVSAVRPFSTTDHLGVRYPTISGYEMLLHFRLLGIPMNSNGDGLTV